MRATWSPEPRLPPLGSPLGGGRGNDDMEIPIWTPREFESPEGHYIGTPPNLSPARTPRGSKESPAGPPAPLEVLHHSARGPRGPTVLDPVLAEVLFVTRWRRLLVRLEPSPYPVVAAVGPLPAARSGAAPSGGPARRGELLAAVAALDPRGYGRPPSPQCEALRGLLRFRVGEAITALLFGDEGIWEDYTRPTLADSAPGGFGWALARGERRRQGLGVPPRELADRRQAALLGLPDALEVLAERLGVADSFGAAMAEVAAPSEAALELTALDACAYGHLAVLYSIPCEAGSNLRELLARCSIPPILSRLALAWPCLALPGLAWPCLALPA